MAPPAGSLDTSFGTGGKVTTAIGSDYDYANAVAIQSDGKIVVAGYFYNGTNDDFALVRYNANGSLDTSFGGSGKVTTAIGSGMDRAYAVAIQPDGRIVAVGLSNTGTSDNFALVRYNTDGSLDTSFNSDGKTSIPFASGNESASAVAIQADGKIVVGGYTYNGTYADFALIRVTANGLLDTSFDTDGKVTTAMGSGDDRIYAIGIQADGKIVAAGDSGGHFAVARYNTDGSLDDTFDTDGKVITVAGSTYGWAFSMAIQPDGKIVAAGFANDGGSDQFALVRYNADGSLDNTFDGDGIAKTAVGPSSGAFSVAIANDGKILAAGYSSASSDSDFALARYNPNGSLDTSFDGDGKVTTDVGSKVDEIYAIGIQGDGKIVAAGNSASADFVLVRYWP